MLDRLTEAARLAGAVNCIKREGDALIGDNTDGKGFLSSLRSLTDPAGKSTVVIGAGGAARAIVAELSLAGAARITVVNRTLAKAEEVAAAIGPPCEAVQLTEPWTVPRDAEIVVQATTVGMGDADARLPLVWPEGAGHRRRRRDRTAAHGLPARCRGRRPADARRASGCWSSRPSSASAGGPASSRTPTRCATR